MSSPPRAPAEPEDDPVYWLGIGDCAEAISAFSRAPSELDELVYRYPILALPELPDALDARAAALKPDAARAFGTVSRTLRAIARSASAEQPESYASLLANCGLLLRDAPGGDRARNVRRARRLFAEGRALAGSASKLAPALMNEEGITCSRLADLGVEPEAHLRAAAALYREACERGAAGPERAGWLMNEAHVRERLAEMGVEAVQNLQAAAELRREAQAGWPPGSAELREALAAEVRIRYTLAQQNVEARANLERAIALERAARDAGITDAGELGRSLAREAMARVHLAQRAVDVRLHAEEALRLCAEARRLAPGDAWVVGVSLLEAGNAHVTLGRLTTDGAPAMRAAIESYEAALRTIPPDSPDAHGCQLNLVQARAFLDGSQQDDHQEALVTGGVSARYWLGLEAGRRAVQALFAADTAESLVAALAAHPLLRLPELPRALSETATAAFPEGDVRRGWVTRAAWLERIHEDEYRRNPAAVLTGLRACAWWLMDEVEPDSPVPLRRAIALFAQLRGTQSADSPAVPILQADEAVARHRLAGRDVDPETNLEAAIRVAGEARAGYGPDEPRGVPVRITEALARIDLALLGREPRRHAEAAVALGVDARRLAAAGAPTARAGLLVEGQARVILARLGLDARANLESALRLATEARTGLDAGDVQAAESLILESGARARLAELGVDPRANAELAMQLAREARERHPESALEPALTESAAATILAGLASPGAELARSLEAASDGLAQARSQVRAESRDAARCLSNEATLRLALAERGDDPRRHLEAAVVCCQQARTIGQRLGIRLAHVSLNEARARHLLAGQGVEPVQHLTAALDALADGARWLGSDSHEAARHAWNEVGVRLDLARLGVEPEPNRARASELGARAAQIFARVGAPREALEVHRLLGRQAMARGDWEAARAAFAAGIESLEAIRGSTVVIRDRREWMERNVGLFRDAVEACLRVGRYDDALALAERGRSRALVDLLAVEELAPGPAVPEETAEAYRRLRRRAEELEALLDRAEGNGPADTGDAERGGPLADARTAVTRDLHAIEERLRQADPDFVPLARPLDPDGMRALARRLGRTLVIVWVGRSHGALFLVRPGGETATVAVPGLGEEAVRALTQGPEGGAGWVPVYAGYRAGDVDLARWMTQIDETVRALDGLIGAPLRRWLHERGETRIAIVAAGPLGLLPLHAVAGAGGSDHLLDQLDVVYAPSAWVLDRCARRARPAWTPILAVANPEGTGGLPWSEREIASIEALVEPRMGRGSVSRLTGSAASLAEVTGLLPAHPVVHFASHATWDPAEPLRSAVLLAGGERLTIGRLLGRDRLDGARLVVLSACESAAGYRAGSDAEEYLGLPAGFILAGAKAVIGTLWSVADLPAALLMRRLYEALLTGQDEAAALRTAQRWLRDLPRDEVVRLAEELGGAPGTAAEREASELLRSRLAALGDRPFAHPHFWAPFQVLGAPDPLVGAPAERRPPRD